MTKDQQQREHLPPGGQKLTKLCERRHSENCKGTAVFVCNYVESKKPSFPGGKRLTRATRHQDWEDTDMPLVPLVRWGEKGQHIKIQKRRQEEVRQRARNGWKGESEYGQGGTATHPTGKWKHARERSKRHGGRDNMTGMIFKEEVETIVRFRICKTHLLEHISRRESSACARRIKIKTELWPAKRKRGWAALFYLGKHVN